MRLAPLALLLLVAVPASAQSDGNDCDDGGLHHEAVLRVQEADGTVRAEVQTGIWSPPCSRPPDSAFSGRWVAYREGERVVVVDWASGEPWDGSGSLPSTIGPLHLFGLQNDTLFALDQSSGLARWLDLATGATGIMTGLQGQWLFGGMAVAIQEAELRVSDIRQGRRVAAVPLGTMPLAMRDPLASNAAYTVVHDPDNGDVGLVHHATGAVDVLVRYPGASAAYLDDGHVAVEVGPDRFTPWGQEPVAVYREPFDDGPSQVVHLDGRLWGHSKGLYLGVTRVAEEAASTTRTGTPDDVIEVPPPAAGLAMLALALAASRRR